MTLSATAATLLVALIAGLASVISAFVSRPSQRRRQEEWSATAEKLRRDLARQYESTISYLQGQCAAKDKEIERLNRSLARRHGRTDD